MKRNSALIRKLRTLSEESHRGVLDDIAKTNQSKVGSGWCACWPGWCCTRQLLDVWDWE